MQQNYYKYRLYPKPSINRLYPNLKFTHSRYNTFKNIYAKKLKLLNVIWNLPKKIVKKYNDVNIYSINHKEFTKIDYIDIELKDKKYYRNIKNIILCNVNRKNGFIMCYNENIKQIDINSKDINNIFMTLKQLI